MLQFTITHTFLGPLIIGLQIMEGVWQFVNHNIINFPTQKWYNCNDEHLGMIFSITMNAFESLTDCSLCHTNCKIIFFSQQCNGTGKTGENMSRDAASQGVGNTRLQHPASSAVCTRLHYVSNFNWQNVFW